MRHIVLGLTIVAALIAASMPLMAHHSFAAEFDSNKQVKLSGVVTKIDWTNPHAFIYLEVKNDKGNTVEWEVEMMSLNHLRGYGWTRSTVKPGDVISCTGGAAKSGATSMISSYMKLGDGRMMKS